MSRRFVEEKDIVIQPVPKRLKYNLTGEQFGETGCVIGYAGHDKDNSSEYYVRCSCGKIFITEGRRIRGRKNREKLNCCPECKDKILGKQRIKDLTGERVGRLQILCMTEHRNSFDEILYFCKCECYNFCLASSKNLRNIELGRCGTKSCGCLHKEVSKHQMIKHNIAIAGKYRGEGSPRWNPDKERVRDRVQWLSKETFKRDGYKCILCHGNKKLNAHHLDGHYWRISKRRDITNLVTLCKECHKEFHRTYTGKYSTRDDFMEFWNQKSPLKTNIKILEV